MANIKKQTETKVFTITQWFGLNENPDGDTKLRMGEATICTNWKITRDRNLRRRPGYRVVSMPSPGNPVMGMWSGIVNNKDEFIAAAGGHLYKLWNNEVNEFYTEPVDLGLIDTENRVSFFPFNGIVYILNGKDYMQYDGVTLDRVEGYRPLVANAMTPAGVIPDGGFIEEVNKLTGARRVWYSPDGTDAEFHLPEKDVISVDYVMINATGTYISPADYTIDKLEGTVTFDTAPEAGTNTIEIGYTGANSSQRSEITRMRYAELYLGASDTAVMLYGDGSNEILYSSIDYWGQPRADYFPDLNEIAVGDSNTPVTGVIRHYSNLLCYKTDQTHSINFGLITKADGNQEYAFYVNPINKSIGNVALGQVQQVLNSPRTVFGSDLYEWRNNASYSSNLNRDERQARRISDRIYSTLSTFTLKDAFCFDDNYNQEYYICNPSTKSALVHNYSADAWYYYTNWDMRCAACFLDELYFGDSNGNIEYVSDNIYSDNNEAFKSEWESGSMDFNAPYMRKFSNYMWVVIKPESRGHVGVTIRTDKKSDFAVKDTDSYLMDFWDIDFRDWSFDVNRSPQTHRHKLKAKKFTFYKLRFESDDATTGATVLMANMRTRFTGYAK